jgi:hypothetical protein
MKKLSILIIVVLLSFIKCSKETNNESLCSSPTLINQVNSGDLAVHGILYNINCLISESTEPFKYKKFTYDTQNILQKVEVANSFDAFSCAMIPGQALETDPRKAAISEYSTFEYGNDLKISKKSYYYINNGNTKLTSWQTFEYNNGNIVRLNTFNAQGNLTGYYDYTYDSKGNITKYEDYRFDSAIILSSTHIYEFDNKINPYKVFACEGIPGKYTNTNNIVKETYISYYGTSQNRYTTSTEYSYNSIDYPVRINDLVCIYGK